MPAVKRPAKTLISQNQVQGLFFTGELKKNLKNWGLHNILFSENYEEEFDTIFSKKIHLP